MWRPRNYATLSKYFATDYKIMCVHKDGNKIFENSSHTLSIDPSILRLHPFVNIWLHIVMLITLCVDLDVSRDNFRYTATEWLSVPQFSQDLRQTG